MKFLAVLFLLLAGPVCRALEQEAVTPGVVPGVQVSILQWLLSCIAVIALMFALAWMLKRSRFAQGGRAGLLQVAAVYPLSGRERLMLVRAADRYLLLGITAQQISLITELSAAEVEAATAPRGGAGSFAGILAGAFRKNAGNAGSAAGGGTDSCSGPDSGTSAGTGGHDSGKSAGTSGSDSGKSAGIGSGAAKDLGDLRETGDPGAEPPADRLASREIRDLNKIQDRNSDLHASSEQTDAPEDRSSDPSSGAPGEKAS